MENLLCNQYLEKIKPLKQYNQRPNTKHVGPPKQHPKIKSRTI